MTCGVPTDEGSPRGKAGIYARVPPFDSLINLIDTQNETSSTANSVVLEFVCNQNGEWTFVILNETVTIDKESIQCAIVDKQIYKSIRIDEYN
jgi:hypothetical protein